MLREIEGYAASSTRVPASPLLPHPLTLSERTGPVELARKWNAGPLDLCRAIETGPRALGQLISVTGRVSDGAPDGVRDPVLHCVPDVLRRRLFATRNPELDAEGFPAYRFDIILRGEGETPFFVD